MAVDTPGLLDKTAGVLCKTLEEMLPDLDIEWWRRCVVGKLSFQQKQHVDRRGISRLEQLDLAALLRIVDQNWYELAEAQKWAYEGRNFVKEMQTVRNRWAHAQVAPPLREDVYRDLDTLHRFLTLVCATDNLTARVAREKASLLDSAIESASEPAPSRSSESESESVSTTRFVPGDVVRLQADPSKSGAVTKVMPGEKETRYQVFHDGQIASYYESQLLPVDPDERVPEVIDLDAFHARLTALQLLHPSTSNLYSLHAARIDVIPYQFRPVLRFIQSDRPRLLIADSVGVGKTIEAGLILRELQARRDVRRVLIVCPRPLVTEDKWRREMKRFDERFEHLDGRGLRFCISETDLDGEWPEKYEKAIIPFSLLTDELLHGKGREKGIVDLDPPPQFDLVIVDEAHHIRNTDTQRHQAIRFLCDNAEAVVFLTATPIQLHDRDLFVLLNTLRPDVIIDEAGYEAITEPNGGINMAAAIARKGEVDWAVQARAALAQAAETAWGRDVLQENPHFQEVYDSLSDADRDRASRVKVIRDIEQLHTLSGLMNRTLRRDIGEFTQRKAETVSVEFTPEQRQLHDAVLAAQAAVYAALHGDRSVNFLLTTIRRQTASCIHGLAPLLRGILSRRMGELEWEEIAEQADEPIDAGAAASRITDLISKALALAEELDPDPSKDPKFLELKKVLDQKQSLPNNKVMLFSSFRHTLAYLYEALQRAGCRVGLIHGGVGDADRVMLRARFEMPREERDALDILLFSEVGCEGLDYQFCDCMVNYDLPWNPMRIDQRIGRIDRWGQTSEAVAIYNLIIPGTVDADIYERCLLRIGVFERALGANEAILGKITRDITNVAENLMLSPEERQVKLDQLADNGIRLVREQHDLETRQTELFGLRVPHDQFKEDVNNATSYWLSSLSLERLASQYLCTRTGKGESALRGDGPKKVLRLSRAARDALLLDFAELSNRGTAIAREWVLWLKGSDPNLSITFDAEYAGKDRAVCLITPVHPLVRQAARALDRDASSSPISGLQVSSATVPPGDYPFAVYQWQYHGIRSDVDFAPVTVDAALTAEFSGLLPRAEGIAVSEIALTHEMHSELERRHYELWSDARAKHLEETTRVASFRRGSLETSHRARVAILDAQLSNAANDRIRIMKASQRARAQADYDRRLREIEEAIATADVTSQPVGCGIIRVRP